MPDPLISAETVRNRLAAACVEAGSQRAFAARHGISCGYLCSVLNGKQEPGDSVLRALGLVRIVGYRPAS